MASPAHNALPFSRQHMQPGDRICVAVSGGADSVALLLAVHEANHARHDALGVGLSVAHVHHGLRGEESDADEEFVRQLCLQLDVPLHLHRASVPDRVKATRESIEEAARNTRYQYFLELLQRGEANAVLTAHTLDDQAETVLMKLLRGAWTEGIAAIHPVVTAAEFGRLGTPPSPAAMPQPVQHRPAGLILRPLLSVRHAQAESYLRQRHQPWRHDASNDEPVYTRNRIRHQVLPLLRELNPSLDETLANLAELARDEEAHWQAELARILPQLLLPGKPVRGGGRAVATTPDSPSVALEVERLRSLSAALRRRVVRAAARQLGVRLSFHETARLLALCGLASDPTVAARPGARLQLANHLLAERSARELRLTRTPQPPVTA
ncbi:MAG: tRNA lysidine(34) synthetase TilS [Acidobacteriota bacterium]|nr:tRNA lysidine(34) synthetase TilS [Acidobacteriota bacterium]